MAGAIAPLNVKGVTTTAWPARAMAVSPSLIAESTRSGELVLTVVSRPGRVASSSRSMPRAMQFIAMPSSMRYGPIAEGCQTRSVSVM